MMNLQTFVTVLRGCTDDDTFKKLLEQITSGEATKWLSQERSDLLSSALRELDPHASSLGWAVVLAVLADRPDYPSREFLSHAAIFLRHLSPVHLRHCWPQVRAVADKFVFYSLQLNEPLAAVEPLTRALRRLAPTPNHITLMHPLLMQVCLKAQCYHAASLVLAHDVLEVTPAETGVNVEDVLRYFYYGGMVWIGLKQFTRALDLFTFAIAAPANAASAIVVECYKKLVLVSLLECGTLPPLPKHTAPVVARVLRKGQVPDYQVLADAYASHDAARVARVVEVRRQAYEDDRNLGLVKQCVESLHKRNVQRLTQTFLTLSLADIAARVGLPGPEAAERLILRMVEEKSVCASISQRDGMVAFRDSPVQYNDLAAVARLDACLARSIALSKRARAVDNSIAVSKEYVDHYVHDDGLDSTAAMYGVHA